MTVAALEALELRRQLKGSTDLTRRYIRAAGKLVAESWETSTSGDLRFAEVEGKRPAGFRLINAYGDRFRAAASVDASLGTRFLRVTNMIDSPAKLLAPGTVLRVLRAARAAGRTART